MNSPPDKLLIKKKMPKGKGPTRRQSSSIHVQIDLKTNEFDPERK